MNRKSSSLKLFQEIEYKKPSDVIIEQINRLISTGDLKPGDSLPSERSLAEKFGVGRSFVREALQKLEFYGILKTLPQRGTVVASIGVKALEGLISNVLNLEKNDMNSLLEARGILEIHAARLAAERASDSDLQMLKETYKDYEAQVEKGESAIDEDLLFHVKISEVSKNSVLRSLISLVTPDIITLSGDLDSCADGRFRDAFIEHKAILEAIVERNPEKAAEAMSRHMKMSFDQFKKVSLSHTWE